MVGDEGDDAIGASAVALKRIGLMNALDELCPSSSERGALSRGVGAHVVHAVLPRLGDLREDSGQELEDLEGLASRMRSEGVVI